MRRNWLASAAVAAVAISVPVTASTGPTFAGPASAGTAQTVTVGTAQVVTLSSQQQAVTAVTASTVKTRQLKRKTTATPQTWNQLAAALAKRLVGDPYVYGGTSPAGFDCSGLTQYVYEHTGGGKLINRTAEDQFLQFRPITHSDARPGDLVFFHDTSDPDSYVYHVGVYEGGDDMVAATTYGEGVQLQSFTWGGGTVTFGTITHY
jgi:cell wall-associated NlpC family hydrolase